MSDLLSGVAMGIGAMRLSAADGPGEDEAVGILCGAFDRGIRFVDTANVYAPSSRETGHNERLIARALSTWGGDGSQVQVATKGGLRRDGKKWVPDGRAKSLKAACDASLCALGVETIDLYQLHTVDPRASLSTSLRALAALHKIGKVRAVGLCNVRLEELEEASDVVPIASVQVALSPLELLPLKNGVAEYCAQHRIPLIAHSPLGGHRRRRKIEKLEALRRVAKRHGATPYEIALAWLRTLPLDVVPIPGATTPASVKSSVRALDIVLDEEDLAWLEASMPAAKVARRSRAAVAPDPVRSPSSEVVVFVGYPGAGKSTLAKKWLDRGYVRLNRDDRGGTLTGLLPELDRKLASGECRVVLDNTYPERAARFDVLEIAWRHGVPVRCVWLQTSLEDAQVNAVRRMLKRYGRLPMPEDIASIAKSDPSTFSPDAQFRYRQKLEPPRAEEGFSELEIVEFERAREARGDRKAVFLEYDGVIRQCRSGAPRPRNPDDVELIGARREVLARYAADGYRLFGISYQPDVEDELARACFDRTHQLIGLEMEAYFCPHPPGPALCWCRKPLPGLGVYLIDEYGLDPDRSIMVVSSPADRGFAERLGCLAVDVEAFFEGG